jgi:outer membrane protein OmpA-like peptidoglycan-associated protein
MKKFLLLSLFAALIAVSFAQTSEKKWGIGAGVGPYGGLNKTSLGFMPELYLSRYLTPRLDLMLKGDMGLFNNKLKNDLDIADAFLNLRLKLTDESKKFRPYLYAGPGFLADNSSSGLNLNIGLGSKYYISPATALYLETGFNSGIESTNYAGKNVHDNFWKLTAGIEFDFGKKKDSDMDGVTDKKDKCPDTPAGVKVDVDGCPVDTDGDGVADYVDDCPEVPGLTTLKGCPDADGDGVADKDDKCPNTPKGVKVDTKGCPVDTDGDGVADYLDKCPDTPKDVKVDANGCPIDSDGDGIADYLDKCPTVPGVKENNGCPIEKTAEELEAEKMKIEPVYFDTNKSNVKDSEKAKIEKLVNLLNENSNYSVKISGYTDSKGSDAYNLGLSNRRVSSVVNSVVKNKIKSKRITLKKGFGEANPAATNDTEDGRALNRRVEFEVTKN